MPRAIWKGAISFGLVTIGAFDYIAKPPDLEYLKQSLEAALTLARLDTQPQA